MTIANTEPTNAGVSAIDDQDETILRYLGLNPNSPADRAAVAVCRAYNFDPILKHVVVIPKGGVYITRDGLLHVAHRSGQLDGIVVDQEPILRDGQWVARVSVYRKDMRHPFTFPGRYSATGGNRQYAPEMALKAAESHALRRAFDVTGLPTIDEDRGSIERVEHEPSGGGLAAALADEDSPPESPALNTSGKLAKHMFAVLNEYGIHEREARLAHVSEIVGREIASSSDLTDADAEKVIAETQARIDQPFPGEGEQ